MALQGKGIWIWQIPQCEGGNAQNIATIASNGGFSHALIKIADSSYPYNVNKTTGVDLIPPVVDALKAKGIQVWGWHYVYGYNPLGEAAMGISQCRKYNLDGYVVDAEIEYTLAGRAAVAATYMTELRKGIPNTPIALSTFRWPSYHGNFPYQVFLEKCDYNMPQVYWMKAHNPIYDLTRSFNEFKAMTPYRPVIPTGPAFYESSWQPTPGEVKDFLDTAKSLGCTAANIYSWDDCRKTIPAVWDLVVNYSWPGGSQPPVMTDLVDRYIATLNAMNYDAALDLYATDAVHVTAERTIQGNSAIRGFLGSLLMNYLNNGLFQVTSRSGNSETIHFTWTCVSYRGKVLDGSDTIGIKDGKIVYHYTHFTITS
ncbi:MAG: nuclear transport factor 2 family protein [Chloroflexi bacterium]|nr:nuclear transport factor 2 family protein [Chloroflexota bacterium]